MEKALPKDFNNIFSELKKKYMQKHVSPEMPKPDIASEKAFADSGVTDMKAKAETAISTATPESSAVVKLVIRIFEATEELADANKCDSDEKLSEKEKFVGELIAKGVAPFGTRCKAAHDVAREDLKEALTEKKNEQKAKDREAEQSNPKNVLAKKQQIALRTKVPICLENMACEVKARAEGAGMFEPFSFSLCQDARKVVEEDLKNFRSLFEVQAKETKAWKELQKVYASLKPPGVATEVGDNLIKAADKHFPAGVKGFVSADKEAWQAALRGKLRLSMAQPGNEMLMGFAGAPHLAILLPGGGTKTFALGCASTFPAKFDEKERKNVEHDRASLERGLLTSEDAHWAKLQDWDGVYVPPGYWYKEATRSANATMLFIYGFPALGADVAARLEHLAPIAKISKDKTEATTMTELIAYAKGSPMPPEVPPEVPPAEAPAEAITEATT